MDIWPTYPKCNFFSQSFSMKLMLKCFQFWSVLGLRFLGLECSVYMFEGLIFAQSARKYFKFMTPLNLPSTPRMYQISIIDYVPSDCFFAWRAVERRPPTQQVPWAWSHLYSRCHGVYSGMTSLNFRGPQVSQLVITNPESHPRMAHSPCSTCLNLSFRVPKGKCDLLHLYM